MTGQYPIGAVSFFKDGKYQSIMGEQRIELLRKFFLGQDLEGFEPYGFDGGARNPITRNNVNWATAGERVTGNILKEKASDKFFMAYLVCALWSSIDNADETGGEPLDKNYTINDIAPLSLLHMAEDCDSFRATYGELLEQAEDQGEDDEQAGHDFWLTRNDHGVGYWDRGLGKVSKDLTDAAETFGACELYVGDDGMIYD